MTERAELCAIDAYLARLDRALRGPRRVKAELLREVRGGLVDATEAYEAAGLPSAEAQRRALAEFGDVAEIAPDYQAELAVAQSWRTSLLILAVLIPQCFLWDDTEAVAGPTPPQWLLGAVEWGGLAVMLAAAGAVWLAGPGARRFLARRELAAVTGWFGVAVAVTFAAMGSALTVLQTTDTYLLGLAGPARTAVFLLAPLSVVAWSAARCVRTSASGRTSASIRRSASVPTAAAVRRSV